MGKPCDSTGTHFKKYGTHYHVFESPEIEESVAEKAAPGGSFFTTSPNPYEAILSLGELTESIILLTIEAHTKINA